MKSVDKEIARALSKLTEVNRICQDALLLLEAAVQYTFDKPPLKWQAVQIGGDNYAALMTDGQAYALKDPSLPDPVRRVWVLVHAVQNAAANAALTFLHGPYKVMESTDRLEASAKYGPNGKCYSGSDCYVCSESTCYIEHQGYLYIPGQDCGWRGPKDESEKLATPPAPGKPPPPCDKKGHE